MDFTCIVFGVLFTVAGILFVTGKGHIHLSNWKNMLQEEKDKINIVPLYRNVGGMILMSGILFLINGSCPGLKERWFMVAMLLWLIVSIADVLFISKSKRYRKE